MQKWHFWYALENLERVFGFRIAATLWPKWNTTEEKHATFACSSSPVLGGSIFDQWYRETSDADANLLFVQVRSNNIEECQRIIVIFRKQYPDGLVIAYQPGKTGDEILLSEGVFATFHELPVPGKPWGLLSQVEEHLAAANA